MLQFTVDGSVVYRDKMVGVEKPQEFIQEPFGAVINEGDEVGNIITVKDTRTPTNSESMSVIEDVERHCPSHARLSLMIRQNVLLENPTQVRMASSGRFGCS